MSSGRDASLGARVELGRVAWRVRTITNGLQDRFFQPESIFFFLNFTRFKQHANVYKRHMFIILFFFSLLFA